MGKLNLAAFGEVGRRATGPDGGVPPAIRPSPRFGKAGTDASEQPEAPQPSTIRAAASPSKWRASGGGDYPPDMHVRGEGDDIPSQLGSKDVPIAGSGGRGGHPGFGASRGRGGLFPPGARGRGSPPRGGLGAQQAGRGMVPGGRGLAPQAASPPPAASGIVLHGTGEQSHGYSSWKRVNLFVRVARPTVACSAALHQPSRQNQIDRF